jgi:hypothetical protein
MFMKCFKKKLATGFIVASMVCSFSSSAFAETKREVLRENGEFVFIKYTMDNGDYCYMVQNSAQADKFGATSASVALAMQCFQSKEIKNNKK